MSYSMAVKVLMLHRGVKWTAVLGTIVHIPNWSVWGREQQTTYALMITEGRIQVGISFINWR